jgi:hypothetical protein
VHITVPVTAVQSGLKPAIKRILGRAVAGVDDNLRRERFNEMMRRTYEDSEPLFDLARWEATSPEGSLAVWEGHSGRFHALRSQYTDDGGHLNGEGRRAVSTQWAVFLARVVAQRRHAAGTPTATSLPQTGP